MMYQGFVLHVLKIHIFYILFPIAMFFIIYFGGDFTRKSIGDVHLRYSGYFSVGGLYSMPGYSFPKYMIVCNISARAIRMFARTFVTLRMLEARLEGWDL